MDGLGTTRPKIAEIQAAISAAYNVRLADLIGPCRRKEFARPRQIAAALARELTTCSYPQIGRHFRRDHTTILYAYRKITARASKDEATAQELASHRQAIALLVANRPVATSSDWSPPPPARGQPSLRWASRNKRKDITHRGEWVDAA